MTRQPASVVRHRCRSICKVSRAKLTVLSLATTRSCCNEKTRSRSERVHATKAVPSAAAATLKRSLNSAT